MKAVVGKIIYYPTELETLFHDPCSVVLHREGAACRAYTLCLRQLERLVLFLGSSQRMTMLLLLSNFYRAGMSGLQDQTQPQLSGICFAG